MPSVPVGVDVTAHTEERNVTDPKHKLKLRVRYYIELVLGSTRTEHTRLAFSGTFKALAHFHRAFLDAYIDRHGENAVPKSNPSTPDAHSGKLQSFVLKLKRSNAVQREKRRSTSTYSNSDSGGRLSTSTHSAPGMGSVAPPIVPFPEVKLLDKLQAETMEARDDNKTRLRSDALFEYYSSLLNSEDGDLYLGIIQAHCDQAAVEKEKELRAGDAVDGSESNARLSQGIKLWAKLSGKSVETDIRKSGKEVAFQPPIQVHPRGTKVKRRHRRHKSRS